MEEISDLFNFFKASDSKKSYYHELRSASRLGDYLLDLCSRTYWSRLWIVQEVILASSIVIKCGEAELTWSLAVNFVTNYSAGYIPHLRVSRLDQGRPTMTVSDKIWKHRRLRSSLGYEAPTLFDMVQFFENAKCADLRDRVYAVIGLSQTCCQYNVAGSYHRSPSELCQIVLQHHLFHHEDSIKNAWGEKDSPVVDLIDLMNLLGCPSTEMNSDPLVSETSGPLSVASLACISHGQVVWYLDHSSCSKTGVHDENRPEVFSFIENTLELDQNYCLTASSPALQNPRKDSPNFCTTETPVNQELANKLVTRLKSTYFLDPEETSRTSVLTSTGFFTQTLSAAKLGNLVFSHGQGPALFLRREGQELRLFGTSAYLIERFSSKAIVSPGKEAALSFSNSLFVDFENLRALCEFFSRDIRDLP